MKEKKSIQLPYKLIPISRETHSLLMKLKKEISSQSPMNASFDTLIIMLINFLDKDKFNRKINMFKVGEKEK